jgi:hypothetical protein
MIEAAAVQPRGSPAERNVMGYGKHAVLAARSAQTVRIDRSTMRSLVPCKFHYSGDEYIGLGDEYMG